MLALIGTSGILYHMKKAISKKVTIDDLSNTIDNLAIMVSKGFDGVHKEMGEIKGRLGNVEDRLGNVEGNLVATRQDILNLGERFVMKYEFQDLASRVMSLEQKQKVKR